MTRICIVCKKMYPKRSEKSFSFLSTIIYIRTLIYSIYINEWCYNILVFQKIKIGSICG